MLKPVKLKYTFDALEPIISSETLEEHYNVLYMKYINNVNKIINDVDDAIKYRLRHKWISDDFLKNSLGGYINHSIYFESLVPPNYPMVLPYSKLDQLIGLQFGGVNKLKDVLMSKMSTFFGSGYVMLVVDGSDQLSVIEVSNQDTCYLEQGLYPLLVLDLWEHSYYLDYKAKRDGYVVGVMKLLDFQSASKRYVEQLKLRKEGLL